jgi:hypothetical protein
LADRRARQAGARSDVGQINERIGLYPIHLRTGRLDALDGGTDGRIDGFRFSRKVRNDVALLKRDRRVVAARVVKARLEVVRLRIEAGRNDAELILFRCRPPFRAGSSLWLSPPAWHNLAGSLE